MRGQTIPQRREDVLPLPTRKRSRTSCLCGLERPAGAAGATDTGWGERRLFLGLTLGAATVEKRCQGQPRSPEYPAGRWEPEAPLCLPGESRAWGQAPLTPGHREKTKCGARHRVLSTVPRSSSGRSCPRQGTPQERGEKLPSFLDQGHPRTPGQRMRGSGRASGEAFRNTLQSWSLGQGFPSGCQLLPPVMEPSGAPAAAAFAPASLRGEVSLKPPGR